MHVPLSREILALLFEASFFQSLARALARARRQQATLLRLKERAKGRALVL
jgi:hypothetical protein